MGEHTGTARGELRACFGWLACAVVCACTRAPQTVASDPPAPDTSRASGSASAGSARSAGGAPQAARRYTLPTGCVPPGKRFACNPIDNDGCDQRTGEACDDDTKGGFACYPAPNEIGEKGECNDKEGPSCAPGFSCDTPGESHPDGICRKLCCSNADCASAQAKQCVAVDREYGTLGFCR